MSSLRQKYENNISRRFISLDHSPRYASVGNTRGNRFRIRPFRYSLSEKVSIMRESLFIMNLSLPAPLEEYPKFKDLDVFLYTQNYYYDSKFIFKHKSTNLIMDIVEGRGQAPDHRNILNILSSEKTRIIMILKNEDFGSGRIENRRIKRIVIDFLKRI